MKIAYIVEPRPIIGGGVRAAINLINGMKSYYGEEAVIFGVHKGTVKDSATEFIEVDTLKPISVSYWKQLHAFIKSWKPDVVHCLGLYTALLCIVYRKVTGRKFKLVCTVHRVTMNMRFRSLMKWVIKYISKHLDYTTFLTKYQEQHYRNNVGFTPKKYTIVPNVIYVQEVDDKERLEIRESLLEKLNADYLASYVGRIIPSKNLEDFIKIIALANKSGLNIGGVLVGGYSEEYFEKLQQTIREEKITDKIVFIGFVNTPTLYTSASDITLTTTYSEALPNLLIESFALGKVTFSSDIPQMTDLINQGVNGYTLPLSNLQGFADAMQKFFTNDTMRKDIEKAARSTYENKYAPEKVARVYHETYSKIL